MLADTVLLDPDTSPVRPARLDIRAVPVPLIADDPNDTRLGPLRLLGAWQLTSDHPGFGGISALLAQNGRLLGVTDRGALIGLGRPPETKGQWIAPLPLTPGDRKMADEQWDSESVTADPVTGRYWIGFELIQRICRYAPRFARLERCRTWPEMEDWPGVESIESLARLPDGRFLVISEGGTQGNALDALLFAGDPTAADTPHPIRIGYRPPPGYRPTDAVAIDGHRLLVMNRRATVLSGFTGALAIIDITGVRAGDVVDARVIARFEPPVTADNYEGLAIERIGDRALLWVVSDDNHKFFQRTLLLAFILPPELAGSAASTKKAARTEPLSSPR